ncbi:AraC family transcriptional regulator [Paenibacillus eucommiae]|uniref:AraC-like DNA-binding protein n=1 Tax=Paenibacillus eucommiae TaxID=1355755 RepID=A0ABS4IYQ4_9BACL|nr:AraC family transcriptional regulator [Paenibacillus eucommiae]MBP1992722.1 AraC-like DNA-binding protein [Paenibacillus eucommiae]
MDSNSLYHSKLMAGEYHPKVVAYYFKQWHGYQMPFHSHNAVEIMYVITGACRVEMEKEKIVLKKGDFILIDANVSHRMLVDDDMQCRMLNVEFIFHPLKNDTFPCMKELAAENSALKTLLDRESPYIVLREQGEVYQTLKSLVLELDAKGEEKELMVKLLLSQLLIRISRLVVEGIHSNMQEVGGYVKKIIAYMHHNYDCDIKVKDIAASVNLHPGYLHRIFKATMNNSVMDYLTLLRIEKAKMLLAQTDIPVIDISGYIGINSRQYFSTIFKKQTGKTPVQFRKSVEALHWGYNEL